MKVGTIVLCLLGILFLAACGSVSYTTPTDVFDASTFGPSQIRKVETDFGLAFPPGTLGVHYAYFGNYFPDPPTFVKLEIPATEIAGLITNINSKYPDRGARASGSYPMTPAWYTPSVTPYFTRVTPGTKHMFIRITICEEAGNWFLYLQGTP